MEASERADAPGQEALAIGGLKIRAEREARGWTVYRLACEAGVSERIVSRIERCLSVHAADWEAVCRALGKDVAHG